MPADASAQTEGIRLSVVIPAYNEESRLPATLAAVTAYLRRQRYDSELLVVSDGATDRTPDLVRDAMRAFRAPDRGGLRKIDLIEYPDRRNRGKGFAVRTGMLAARGQYRVFMDADNSTTVDHAEAFFPVFTEGGFDGVIGSRDIEGAEIAAHQPWYKEFAGNLGNLFIRLLVVPGIYDTQAGFKMFTAAFVEDVFPRLTIDRWGFDVEILAVARKRGYRIKETPITWVNDPRSLVKSSAYISVLGEVLRIRWNLWTGVYDRAHD
jgi:dolichyl-phosphate beta-glucosyltransferase